MKTRIRALLLALVLVLTMTTGVWAAGTGSERTAGARLTMTAEYRAGNAVVTVYLEGGEGVTNGRLTATYDPKVDKEMGRLDFTQTTRECVNRVRAMSPWPCAFVPLAEGALKVWNAAAFEEASGVPGTVLRANKRDGLVVATGDGALSLLEVQAPNARRMDAKAFLLGHPIPEGTMLDEVRL